MIFALKIKNNFEKSKKPKIRTPSDTFLTFKTKKGLFFQGWKLDFI